MQTDANIANAQTVDRIKPDVLFRCDATPEMGGGHVMRCLTLANAMAEAGYKIRFACAEGTIETVPMLGRSGFNILDLTDPLDSTELFGRLEAGVDVAVFDHYGIGAEYERALRVHAKAILVIDDPGEEQFELVDIREDRFFGLRQGIESLAVQQAVRAPA